MEFNCVFTLDDLLDAAELYYKHYEWYMRLISLNSDAAHKGSQFALMWFRRGKFQKMLSLCDVDVSVVQDLRRFYRRLSYRTDASDLNPYIERYWKALINE